MANRGYLAILESGANSWNAWRAQNHGIQIDLSGAVLRKADLVRTDLVGVDLGGAILSDTNLMGANLSHACLSGADLQGVDLSYADLSQAELNNANLGGVSFSSSNLRHANLYGADLSVAYLFRANLRRADLRCSDLSRTNLIAVDLGEAMVAGANLGSTVIADTDLSCTIGLSSVHHHGPSTIGIDTISRSKGVIPDAFLVGAGVSNTFISYAKSLVGSAIEFYSCFISYSTKDQEFADRVYSDLQAKGVRCWFAPHDVQGGRKLHEQIDEAIRLHDKLLVILSGYSMASEWVKTEISKARRREVRDGVRVLFPIDFISDYVGSTPTDVGVFLAQQMSNMEQRRLRFEALTARAEALEEDNRKLKAESARANELRTMAIQRVTDTARLQRQRLLTAVAFLLPILFVLGLIIGYRWAH